MSDNLTKTAKFVDSWWKILSVAAAIILVIYQVSVMWLTVKELDGKLEQMQITSDKRYERATEMYNELKNHGIDLTKDIQKHLIEDAYFRGRTEAKIEDLEKNK